MADNLSLWNLGRRPDPDHLKWVDVGRGYTTAEAQYQVEKATRLLGPYGIGWGMEYPKYEVIYDIGKPVMVILMADFWYKYMGEDGRFPLVNSIIWKGDDPDLLKKLGTDWQSKALSKIGIDADLFKGLWGKKGSKKPEMHEVVYLGKSPLNDIPAAKESDHAKVNELLDELNSDERKKANDWLEEQQWNHFAVRTMIKKLSERKEKGNAETADPDQAPEAQA